MFYDAVIIHSGHEEDVDIAKQFCNIVENLTLSFNQKIYLIEEDLEENYTVIKNSTYKFIIVSKNLSREKWSDFLKNIEIMEAMKDEELQWSLIPVYVDNNDEYEIPFGMKVLNSIDYKSNTSLMKVKEFLNQKQHFRQKREEKALQQKMKEHDSGQRQPQAKVCLGLQTLLFSFSVYRGYYNNNNII